MSHLFYFIKIVFRIGLIYKKKIMWLEFFGFYKNNKLTTKNKKGVRKMNDTTDFMNNYEKNIDRVVETFANTEVLDSWSSIQGLWKFVKEVFGDTIEYDIVNGELPAWKITEYFCRYVNDGIENGKKVDMIDTIRVGKDNALLLLVKYE